MKRSRIRVRAEVVLLEDLGLLALAAADQGMALARAEQDGDLDRRAASSLPRRERVVEELVARRQTQLIAGGDQERLADRARAPGCSGSSPGYPPCSCLPRDAPARPPAWFRPPCRRGAGRAACGSRPYPGRPRRFVLRRGLGGVLSGGRRARPWGCSSSRARICR